MELIRMLSPIVTHRYSAGSCFADTVPPVINSIFLTSTGPDPQIARSGWVLTLAFTVSDELQLAVGSPPASFVVAVGPAGSAAPTFQSAQNEPGTARRYTYTWTVPDLPVGSTLGYSISVTDAASNIQTAAASAVVTIGEIFEPFLIFKGYERC